MENVESVERVDSVWIDDDPTPLSRQTSVFDRKTQALPIPSQIALFDIAEIRGLQRPNTRAGISQCRACSICCIFKRPLVLKKHKYQSTGSM